MTLTAQPAASLWINGTPVEGEGAVLPVLFAYDGSTIAELHEASPDQVAQACAAALAALDAAIGGEIKGNHP